MTTGAPWDAIRVHRRWLGGGGPSIAVVEVKAPAHGPVAMVVANLHGDECVGLGVAHALAEELARTLVRGAVHLLPSLNPEGLSAGCRNLPGEPGDPNRAFPGNPRGRPIERHAARLWGEIVARRPEVLIDLHSDSGGAIPYAIVDRVVRGADRHRLAGELLRLAGASGLTVLREYPPDRYLRFELDRSLPGALVNGPGVPAVTLELGPRRRIDPEAVALGTRAALGVLTALELVDRPAPPHPTRRTDGPWRRESGPRATGEGLVVPRVRPGQAFVAGEPIAEIRALDGTVREVLLAESNGFVVAFPEVAFVAAGAACATVAVAESPGVRP